MPDPQTTVALHVYSEAQWRMLNYLFTRSQETRPVVDLRHALRLQGCDSDRLLELHRNDLVVGLIHGSEVDLENVNFYVLRRSRNHVSVRITPTGDRVVSSQPAMMVMRTLGRGHHRYAVKEVLASAGVSQAEALPLLTGMEQAGLLTAHNDSGETVELSMFSRVIPPGLRLSLTRKAQRYLERRSH